MDKSRIYLSQVHQAKNELKYIQEAFLNNELSIRGANIDIFESLLENYLGNDLKVIALNSGTSAIHLGLVLLGVQAGDEVLCQTMTFSASANPILYQGATPVFIDSESLTGNLCPFALENAILDRISKGKKPKAIIAVHSYGVPYQIDKIRFIADSYNIPILEDAAEALGSKYKGINCGNFGDVSIFSFNGNKIITSSNGGALVVKNLELKQKALFYATQSKDNAVHYEHSKIGYNYRMSNICAGIGRAQMEMFENHVSLRRSIHLFYKNLFLEIDCVTVYEVPNEDYYSNCWLSIIYVEPNDKEGFNCENLRKAFEFENIEVRRLWKPLHKQPFFEKYPFYGLNVAENLFSKGLCLPSSSNLSDIEKNRITKVVSSFFKII